ncbi:MAG TPA: ABC transporter substrate-binding protein [Candidatus Limnocylindria bacterium]|nr:ABC transporter substrate-binding protein [Candidatus Limnocylindria bacterium]
MIRAIGIGFAALLVATSCASPAATPSSAPASTPAATTAPAATAAAPYEIHVILPLTGGAAFLGKPEQQALDALQGVVNKGGGISGRPVKFTYYDDASTAATDVQLVNQIIAKNVPVILGPSLVGSCNAAVPVVAKGPVLYCFSPGIHPDKDSYAFTSSVSTVDLNRALFKYFKAKGLTKIATITSTDATGQDADSAIKTGVSEATGVTLVAQEHFNTSDVSVSAQIARIKASGAQALVGWSTGTPIATVLRAAAQAGLDIPIATTDGNMTYAQMEQYAAFLPKELLIPAPEWPAAATLPAGPVKDALKVYGDALAAANVKPDIGTSLAWDPALIVIEMLKKLGPQATATQLRDAINGLKGFSGVNGTYDFTAEPQRGLNSSQALVTHWDATTKAWVPVSAP